MSLASSTSISARAQCWLLLPTRTIAPFGTCQTVPSAARSRVVRSDTASTAPLTCPSRSTTSPTPNWSSARMNRPDRKSFTNDCDPNPSATPTTPAPASSGATSTPTSLSIMKIANSKITKPARLRTMLVSALMRCSARRLVSVAVSSSAPGERRRTEISRSRTMPWLRLRSARSMTRPTSLLTISAPIAIRTSVSGVPKTKSEISASVRFSVRSRISRQIASGSEPHVSRTSVAVMSASMSAGKTTEPDASSGSGGRPRRRYPPRARADRPSQPLNNPT